MIEAQYYQIIYEFTVAIITIGILRQYSVYYRNSLPRQRKNLYLKGSLFLAIIITIFIGFRPFSGEFVDMMNYYNYYEFLEDGHYKYDIYAENFLFNNLFAWIASNNIGKRFFFVMMAIINFVGTWIAAKKMFPKDTMLAYLTFLAAFSTFSYATNGIKAGASASLFLIAIAYIDKKLICSLFLLLSLGFHHSMILPISAFLLAYFIRKPKLYFFLWLICLFVSLLHIKYFQNMFAGLTDEHGAEYLLSNEDWGGKLGFRLDFVIYSSIPIIVGYYALFVKRIKDKAYGIILSTYIITNSIWVLCMYAAFTNRIAYLSWIMYPFALIYPIANCEWGTKNNVVLRILVAYNLCFTIFMDMIYYRALALG